jgi:hypothetical protein
MTGPASNSLEYARRLYADVLGWYHSAETKAQVVIGIDGAFVAFLTASIFQKPEDLKGIVAAFSSTTWILFGLMSACLIVSLAAGIFCLWSRIYSENRLQDVITQACRPEAAGDRYDANVMWFFQFVAAIKDDCFRRTLETADENFELNAMEAQIPILSGHVRLKHQAANLGFLFSSLTLVLFLFAGLSYAGVSAF